jgi:hypothetical protein
MEDDSAIVEEEKVSSTEETNNLSGILQDTPPTPVEQGDLSGLAQESDLSGLVVDTQSGISATPAPESDLSGLAADTTMASAPPADFSTPVSPQTTAAPINAPATPPPAFQPGVAPMGTYPAAPAMPAGTYAAPYPAAPPMPQAMPAAGYAQPYPPVAPQAPAPSPIQIGKAPDAVVGALSAFGQTIPVTRDSFKPQDELPSDDTELVVKEITLAEKDDEITRQVMQYVGTERRDKLFNEIETLYGLVSAKLNGNKKDVNFALDTLRQAHNLILESPREYDEAFYRVAVVKTILNRKTDLSSWSYSWGLFVLLYGILWLAACLSGSYYIIVNAAQLLDPIMSLPFQSLFCAFAGGIGGCVAVLWTLYYRVSVKQDFDRQYLMFYLVKPILGFVLGLVMFFLLISASSIGASGDLQLGFDTATGVALAAFVGFIAGFRQDNVYDWIYVIIKTISPKANEEAQSKSALVPPDIAKEYEQQIETKQVKVTLN